MNINRNNYETFFLLYVDKELTEQERAEVESFVEANPDLQIELKMLQEAVLQPEPEQLAGLKESLLRFSNPVNETNYEEYFVRYGDNELSREEKEFTEQFVYRHPQYQPEFELILEARLVPDNAIVYPNKAELYRSEKDERRVVPFSWRKMAAAAVLILFTGATTWMVMRNSASPDVVTVAETNTNKPAVTPKQNESQQAVPQPEQLAAKVPEQSEENSQSIAQVENTRTSDVRKPEKKSAVVSNKVDLPSVELNNSDIAMNKLEEKTPQVATVKADLSTTGEVQVIDRAVSETELQLASVQSTTPVQQAELQQESDNSNVVYIANTSVSKRNRFRGIIRKASRFIEKATSLEASGSERGVRIANIEIALK